MINFAKYSLLIYLLLKPFYAFSSGGLQIGDIFLLIAFGLLVAGSWHVPNKRKVLAVAIQQHKLFILFVACTFIINSLYFIVYPEFKFFLSSLYFVFNAMAIILFTLFFKDKLFLSKVGTIFKFNLLLQLAIWAIGIGRVYGETRYMGTFNDPNQFGYYVLLSFFFVYIIDMILKKKHTYIFYALALFLIIQSGSTGMLLGIGAFSVLFAAIVIAKQLASPGKLIRRIMHSLAIIAVLAVPLSVIVYSAIDLIPRNTAPDEQKTSIFKRVEEKTDKASGESDASLAVDRNLDMLLEYPHYMIYGAGEGAFGRFERAAHPGNEVHSTFPSILFYYGIIPLLLLVTWLIRQLRGANWSMAVLYISLFVVSFVLLNQRQTLFWALIVLIGITVNAKLSNNTRSQNET